MAFQLPTDLIRQVQIAARNDAGLHSYNPDDPSLPSLPSLDASIFGLDPSTPDYLRCKNCKGKLLRGIQSVICIYCGNQLQNNKDLPPEPISFTSTFGYQWLLHSLDLDQSEIVGPSTEESESNRGHSTSNQETSLHDLLDLQITWPDELEKPDTSVPNKTMEQRSSYSNLNGADLDNVFSGSKRDFDSDAFAQPNTEKQLDSTESKGSISGSGFVKENLTLFSDVHSADSAVKSFEDNQGDSFSGWAADFQSANKDEGSKSFDPYIGSNIDLSSHIDTVFGAGKDGNPGKLENDLQPAQSVSNDWMQDDLWKNVDSEVSQQAAHFGSTAEATDGTPPNIFNNPASDSVDWFEDNQWQKNITSEPSNNVIDKPDDSFDDWNDFASSSNAVNVSGNEPSNKIIDKPDDSFDDWNDFASSSNAVNVSANEPSNKIIDKPDDWNDFASSSNAVNVSGNEPSNKIIDKPDDSFDDWNDFASSSNAVNLSGNAWVNNDYQKAVSSEQTSETDLFSSSSNIEDNEFGSFSKPNTFSVLPGIHDGDAMNNNILNKVHASDRNNNEQSHVKELPENGTALNATTPPKDEVEILMSQMHDLSFMLETNLSVPSKLDGRSSTHHD